METNQASHKKKGLDGDINEINKVALIHAILNKDGNNVVAFEAQYQNLIHNDTLRPQIINPKIFKELTLRNNYIILANGKKRYVCRICHERHATTGNMKYHLLKRHNYVGPPKHIHKCTKCSFGSGQIRKLTKHMKTVHGGKELYSKCHICGAQCERKLDCRNIFKLCILNACTNVPNAILQIVK